MVDFNKLLIYRLYELEVIIKIILKSYIFMVHINEKQIKVTNIEEM